MKSLIEKTDPKSAAIVVIDVQNDFCHDDGAMSKNKANVAPMQAITPRLNGLLDAARGVNLPIIWVHTTHSPETDSPVWTERHAEGRAYICADDSWGADWFDVRPLEGEAVVLKHRYSAFTGTDLDKILRARGIKSVILTGVVTNACVESTARDAFMHDYFVVVARDCTATSQPELHERALDTIARSFGVVASSAEIEANWATRNVAADPPLVAT